MSVSRMGTAEREGSGLVITVHHLCNAERSKTLGVIQKCNLLRLSICLTDFFSSLIQSGFSEEAAAIYFSICCQRRGVIQSSITKKHYIQMESGSMTNLCTLKPK